MGTPKRFNQAGNHTNELVLELEDSLMRSIDLALQLKDHSATRRMSIVVTRLEEARMWFREELAPAAPVGETGTVDALDSLWEQVYALDGEEFDRASDGLQAVAEEIANSKVEHIALGSGLDSKGRLCELERLPGEELAQAEAGGS